MTWFITIVFIGFLSWSLSHSKTTVDGDIRTTEWTSGPVGWRYVSSPEESTLQIIYIKIPIEQRGSWFNWIINRG